MRWDDGNFGAGALRLIVTHSAGRDTWLVQAGEPGSVAWATVETDDGAGASYRVTLPS